MLRYEQLDLVSQIYVFVAIRLVSVARNLLCSNDKRPAAGIRCPSPGEERLLFTIAHSSATQQVESGNLVGLREHSYPILRVDGILHELALCLPP